VPIKMHRGIPVLGLLLAVSLVSQAAWADSVGSGMFTLSGTMSASQTQFDFSGQMAAFSGGTGAFASLSSGNVGIRNLNISSATVSATDISLRRHRAQLDYSGGGHRSESDRYSG